MNIFDKILRNFAYDEPILIEDIETMFPDKSRPWIDKTIKTMVDNDMLKRFSTGVYYIPRKTMFGTSILNPNKVISKKYIHDKDRVYGYISGISLLNSLGLTTQVPNKLTVVTNNEATRGRRINVGSQEVYLIKSPTEVTKQNFAVLQFLEAIKLVDINTLYDNDYRNLSNYISENSITLQDVSKYCVFFPDSVSKKILGGKLIDLLTQQ